MGRVGRGEEVGGVKFQEQEAPAGRAEQVPMPGL